MIKCGLLKYKPILLSSFDLSEAKLVYLLKIWIIDKGKLFSICPSKKETLPPKQYEHEWNKHFVPQGHLRNRYMLSRGHLAVNKNGNQGNLVKSTELIK